MNDSGTRRSRMAIVVAAAALFALCLLPAGVVAEEFEDDIEVSIPWDEYYEILGPYDLEAGETLTIDVEVTSGQPQNFYFMTYDNYVLWDQGATVATVSELCKDNALSMHASWEVERTDDYMFIIENVEPENANIRGTITSEAAAEGLGMIWIVVIAVAVIAVVVIVVVVLMMRNKASSAALPGMVQQPYASAPMPPPPQPFVAQQQPAGPRMCPSCGRTVADGTMAFCPFCGKKMG